ncbi:MAG: hypothetical protein KGZ52_08185 [Xanthomonadaceae bacterium]|jgi:multicomponent Na+:H+ antiporter subunit F|nr:hypothetical protein [Xanthomonadaceae bacterium]
MAAALWAMAGLVLFSLVVGLLRVERGPGPGDRLIAAQLLGSGAVAILLLLAFATGEAALVDAALVLALLAGVALVVFVRRGGGGEAP